MTNDPALAFIPYSQASGPGSTLAYTKPYRDFLVDFIVDNDIHSILDLGCGDLLIMSQVLHEAKERGCTISYLGVDGLPGRVQKNLAEHPDMPCEIGDVREWPVDRGAELVLCKDVIQHWSNAEVVRWLGRIPYHRFALVTNCARGENTNTDIKFGHWRPLDLTELPFADVPPVIPSVVFSWDTKDVVLLPQKPLAQGDVVVGTVPDLIS